MASSIVISSDDVGVSLAGSWGPSSSVRASNSGTSSWVGGETTVLFMRDDSSGVKYGPLIYSSSVVQRLRATAARSLPMLLRSWRRTRILYQRSESARRLDSVEFISFCGVVSACPACFVGVRVGGFLAILIGFEFEWWCWMVDVL